MAARPRGSVALAWSQSGPVFQLHAPLWLLVTFWSTPSSRRRKVCQGWAALFLAGERTCLSCWVSDSVWGDPLVCALIVLPSLENWLHWKILGILEGKWLLLGWQCKLSLPWGMLTHHFSPGLQVRKRVQSSISTWTPGGSSCPRADDLRWWEIVSPVPEEPLESRFLSAEAPVLGLCWWLLILTYSEETLLWQQEILSLFSPIFWRAYGLLLSILSSLTFPI